MRKAPCMHFLSLLFKSGQDSDVLVACRLIKIMFRYLFFIYYKMFEPRTSSLPRQQHRCEPSLVIWFRSSTKCGQQTSKGLSASLQSGAKNRYKSRLTINQNKSIYISSFFAFVLASIHSTNSWLQVKKSNLLISINLLSCQHNFVELC